MLWVGVWTTCVSEKLYNPFSVEKSAWHGLQKSTLKSPIDTKLEKLKGLSWCTAVKRVSKWLQEMVVYKKDQLQWGEDRELKILRTRQQQLSEDTRLDIHNNSPPCLL